MVDTFFVALLLITSWMVEVQSGAATDHRHTRSLDDIAKLSKLDNDLKKMSNLKDLPGMQSQRRSDKPYVPSGDPSSASRGQCYKTFYVRNLRIFVISSIFLSLASIASLV